MKTKTIPGKQSQPQLRTLKLRNQQLTYSPLESEKIMQTPTGLTMSLLQQKYSEERKLLQLQNKQLEQQLYQQINLNQERKLQIQKIQQRHRLQVQILQDQNQTLKNRMSLMLQQQQEPSSLMQEQQSEQQKKTLLQSYKDLMVKYQTLQLQLNELQQTILLQDEQKQHLLHQNQQLNQENENLKMKVIRGQNDLGKVEGLLQSYTKEKAQIKNQFDFCLQQIQRLQQKSAQLEEQLAISKQRLQEQKQKKKQTQQSLQAIQAKFQQLQSKNKQQLDSLYRQLQSQREKTLQLTTKLSFSELSIAKKQSLLKDQESLIAEIRTSTGELEAKCVQLEKSVKELEEQAKRMKAEIREEKQAHEEEVDRVKQVRDREAVELRKKHEEELNLVKKKTIEELYPILKDRNEQRAKTNLQLYLKTFKSSIVLKNSPHELINPPNPSNTQNTNGYKPTVITPVSENPIQRFRLESQLNSLQLQKLQLQKQQQSLSSQLAKSKITIAELLEKLQAQKQLNQELQLRLEKAESGKDSQILQLKREVNGLKSKQTEVLELMRDREEYEEAIGLKIAFYDKKIKELLQTIQRKESIIEKLKTTKSESQQKLSFYEEKLSKLTEESQISKKLKMDITRKDELIRQYKLRAEKSKSQLEDFKESVQNIKKEKLKLSSLLQSKEDYITTIKKKHLKEIQHLEKSLEEKIAKSQTKINKTLKDNYEAKIKKLKKDLQQAQQQLSQIKHHLFSAIEQRQQNHHIKQPQPNPKPLENSSQACKLLGLNPNQLQQFLKPSTLVIQTQSVLSELQHLWQQKHFDLCIKKAFQVAGGQKQWNGV